MSAFVEKKESSMEGGLSLKALELKDMERSRDTKAEAPSVTTHLEHALHTLLENEVPHGLRCAA
jgi:hypothetical protein